MPHCRAPSSAAKGLANCWLVRAVIRQMSAQSQDVPEPPDVL
jgi:hypothetical protein